MSVLALLVVLFSAKVWYSYYYNNTTTVAISHSTKTGVKGVANGLVGQVLAAPLLLKVKT